jgi:polysaccharide export outer membrane protein
MMYFLSIVAASVYGAQAQEASAPVPAQTPTTTASTTPSAASAASQAAGVNPGTYVIGAEDVLAINVWKEPDMSKTVPVRPDGMISLPLIGEIKAAGLTPLQLQDSIATAVKRLISDPQVTVTVSEVHSQNFKIVGQVTKPGFYPLTRRITVLDAIALAGGFKDFAKTKKIYVLRTDASGKQVRLPFNYKQVIKGQHSDEDIALQPNDTVVVP